MDKKEELVKLLINKKYTISFAESCTGGSAHNIYNAFIAQGFVVLGSNSVPIPGAVGAADYLFIDGFGKIINDSVSIELLSRGISFYCCLVVCGLITFAASVLHSLKGMKQKKKC